MQTILGAGLFLFTSCWASGQAFDVASIKPNSFREFGQHIMFTMDCSNGRFVSRNWSVKNVIAWAYGTRANQISGATGWMDSVEESYDIEAKSAGAIGEAECKQTVQNLLADRFQLKLHRETEELSEYVLAVSKSGAKLKPATAESGSGASFRDNRLMARGFSMTGLAGMLSSKVDRPVRDNTGLTGRYDFELEWTSNEDPPGASIFTAVRSIGLELETRKGPIEFLVIDHIEKPSEN